MILRAKPIAIAGLLFAFLYGAWGNVVAAAFCPRFSDRSCCPKHSAPSSSPSKPHHDLQQMEIEVTGTEACAAHEGHSTEPRGTSRADVFDESDPSRLFLVSPLAEQSCAHCLSHSQPAPGRFSVSSGDSSRESEAQATPLIKLPLNLPAVAKLLPSYDHGPPGQSYSLFVLNSVFRI
jgi:hypothetical protein